jgi:hypothetical protein
MKVWRPTLCFTAILPVLLFGAPAMADVIDGDWCAEDGHHFSIQGPTITTPAGKQMSGQYTRHTFRYVAPDDEAGAGHEISMLLLNELTLHLRIGSDSAVQIWRRCKPTTS